jgi:hypothetical protein
MPINLNHDADWGRIAAPGTRLVMILHHDDATREYAYDRKSPFGRLDRALDQASKRGWTVISMKDDWRQVCPPVK